MSDGGASTGCCCFCQCPIPPTWNSAFVAQIAGISIAYRTFERFGQGFCLPGFCGSEEKVVQFQIEQISPLVVRRASSVSQNYTGFCEVRINGTVQKRVEHFGGLYPPFGQFEQTRTFTTTTTARLSISPDGCGSYPHCDGWNNGEGCFLKHTLYICNFKMGAWTSGGELDAMWGCDSPNQILDEDAAQLHNSGGSITWTSNFKEPKTLISGDWHGARLGAGAEFEGELGFETPFVAGAWAVNQYIPREVGFIADSCYGIDANNPDFGVSQWMVPPQDAPPNTPICQSWSRDYLCANGAIYRSSSYQWSLPRRISYS